MRSRRVFEAGSRRGSPGAQRRFAPLASERQRSAALWRATERGEPHATSGTAPQMMEGMGRSGDPNRLELWWR